MSAASPPDHLFPLPPLHICQHRDQCYFDNTSQDGISYLDVGCRCMRRPGDDWLDKVRATERGRLIVAVLAWLFCSPIGLILIVIKRSFRDDSLIAAFVRKSQLSIMLDLMMMKKPGHQHIQIASAQVRKAIAAASLMRKDKLITFARASLLGFVVGVFAVDTGHSDFAISVGVAILVFGLDLSVLTIRIAIGCYGGNPFEALEIIKFIVAQRDSGKLPPNLRAFNFDRAQATQSRARGKFGAPA